MKINENMKVFEKNTHKNTWKQAFLREFYQQSSKNNQKL